MNLIWLQRLTCSGNTHSLLSSEDANLVFEEFEVLFHPSFSVESEEEVIKKVLKKGKLNILVVEGAINKEDDIVKKLCKIADYVIAVGSCAVYGNLPALKDKDVSGLQFRFKEKGGILGKSFISRKGYPVINLSGCPANPEWITGTLLKIKSKRKLNLDELGRPKEYYNSLAHWGCSRNEFFEWKVEAKSLGKEKGCLFYHFGCRGPLTHSTCNVILWNGVNSKTRAGTPCFGCTEYDFPRENLWETKQYAGIPAELPLGVSKRGYIMVSGMAKMFAPERLKNED
ncbi:MAG: Ni/Fe hydrogenase [Aquifex sp.]|nr:MAG: Ni/Fe hydrogenase [Aquifex sp.]